MKNLVVLFALLLTFGCVPPAGPDDARDQAHPGGPGGPGEPGEPDGKGGPEATGPTVDLRYRFAAGQVLKYKATEEVQMAVEMGAPMGMPMPAMAAASFHVITETDFHLIIGQVNPDGSATFTCRVVSFSSFAMPGRALMASHEGLAKDALEVTGTITAKGQVTFDEEVYLVVTEKNEKFYVRAKAGATEASAEASDGETTVSVYAAYDPKTGRVVGGAKATVKNPRKTAATLKVTENDRRVDVLPKQIMELFALPEAPAPVGSAVALQLPGASVQFMVESFENDLATLKMSFAADTAAMSGEDSPAAAMPKMTGLVSGGFAVTAGQLQHVNGKVKTEISSGVNLTITSTFSLKLQ